MLKLVFDINSCHNLLQVSLQIYTEVSTFSSLKGPGKNQTKNETFLGAMVDQTLWSRDPSAFRNAKNSMFHELNRVRHNLVFDEKCMPTDSSIFPRLDHTEHN